MASTGVNNGTLVKLYKSSTLIALLKSNDINLSTAMRDISTKDSAGWKEILPGQKSFKFNCEILHDESKTINANTIMADQIAGTVYTLKMSSAVTGDKYFQGNAYISSTDIKAPNEDNESATIAFEGTGALTIGTV